MLFLGDGDGDGDGGAGDSGLCCTYCPVMYSTV